MFFFNSYRKGIITFCGSIVEVKFYVHGDDVKQCFMDLENGKYKNDIPITRHPNMLKSVLIGKKGWGLWVDQWSEGISECSFTLDEIINEFTLKDIEIPENLLEDLKNRIRQKKLVRNEIEIERLKSIGLWK